MKNRLKKTLASVLETDPENIDSTASSELIDGWDSLKQMNIIVALEEEFDIQFDEEESILSSSYASLYDLIRKKLA